VDTYFNNVVFAVQHNFSSGAAYAFIEEAEEFRRAVTSNISVAELQLLLISLFVPHTKEVEPTIRVAIVAPEPEPEEVKPLPKKSTKKGKAEAPPPPPPEPEHAPVVEQHVHLSFAEVACVTGFLVEWMVQHRNLFRFVFSDYVRPVHNVASFRVAAETAASPVPLAKALPESAFLDLTAKKIVKMQLELRAQAFQEEEELLSAKEEELSKQEEDKLKKLPHESQEITLQLSNVEAKRQVENLSEGVLTVLSIRQQKILERIDVICRKLGL